VEIGGCGAIVVDASVGANTTMRVAHRWFVLAVPDTLAALREKTARSSAPRAD
jgi:hypothetical protein